MKTTIFVFICLMAIGGGMLWAVATAVSLPDVYFSYSTNECVKVVNYGTEYSCENLPKRFYHIWVE